MTNKIMFASAATAISVLALVFAAEQATDAFAGRPPLHELTGDALKKTNRLPQVQEDVALAPDMEGEWVLDCYDQFGPEGATPAPTKLNSCLPS